MISDTDDSVGIYSDDEEYYTFFSPDNELYIYGSNHLPHWLQEDVWYFVTFRQADSIPREAMDSLLHKRAEWLSRHGTNKAMLNKQQKREYYKLFSGRIEELLNAGTGSCRLKEKPVAEIVSGALLHFDKQRYLLDEWVIMPNHVHVLVKPIAGFKLQDILHSWKSYSALQINRLTGSTGAFWQKESYDHIVRNIEAMNVIRKYIKDNPAKAGLKLIDCMHSSVGILPTKKE